MFFMKNQKRVLAAVFIFFFMGFFLIPSCAQKTSEGFIIPDQKSSQRKNKAVDIQKTREQMDGVASWYGPDFHGKKTANGEIYDQNDYTVAHKILPIHTRIRITNLENGQKIFARVNDRGPYKKKRIVDVSKKIAKELGFLEQGTARVRLDVVSYPKNYDANLGITPYKQKVIQIIAYKNSQRLVENFPKIKSRVFPIPIFVDRPTPEEYHVVAGPFFSEQKAKQVALEIQKRGLSAFVRSYRK
jgi:rare lipoprotein A